MANNQNDDGDEHDPIAELFGDERDEIDDDDGENLFGDDMERYKTILYLNRLRFLKYKVFNTSRFEMAKYRVFTLF